VTGTEIAKRDIDPLEGRIVTPGDAYRATMAPWEAPPEALNAWCPHRPDACDWRQIWDTPQEVKAAILKHVDDAHGGALFPRR
jgi:hypothetical protein